MSVLNSVFNGFRRGSRFNAKSLPLSPDVVSDHAWKLYDIKGTKAFVWNINNPAHAHHFSDNVSWADTHLNPETPGYKDWNEKRLALQMNQLIDQIQKGWIVMIQEGYKSFLLELDRQLADIPGLISNHLPLDDPPDLKDRVNMQATYYLPPKHQMVTTTFTLATYPSDRASGDPPSTLRIPWLHIQDESSGDRWSLGNVHLSGNDAQYPKNAVRTLLNDLDNWLASTDFVVAAGDFNTTPDNIIDAYEFSKKNDWEHDGGMYSESMSHVHPIVEGHVFVASAIFPSHINPKCDVVSYDNALVVVRDGKPKFDVLVGGEEQSLVKDLKRQVEAYESESKAKAAQSAQSASSTATPQAEQGISSTSTIAATIDLIQRMQRFLEENEETIESINLSDPLDTNKVVDDKYIETVASSIPLRVADTTASGGGGGVGNGNNNPFYGKGAGRMSSLSNSNAPLNLDPLFFLNLFARFSEDMDDSNMRADSVRLNKNIFFPEGRLLQSTIAQYYHFTTIETTIRTEVINRLSQIFSLYDMSYSDEQGKPVKSSVYNKPLVKTAVIEFLKGTLADLFLFGYTVVGVPRDLIDWVDRSLKSGVYNPALGTEDGHKVNLKAFNRLPQRTSQNSTDILPYVHIEVDKGDLARYHHRDQGGPVFMFEPTDPGIRAMEKKFRTFVVVMPHKEPRGGNLQTGLYAVYQEWSRFRAAHTNYITATAYQSRPIIIVDQEVKSRINFKDLDPNLKAYIINRFPDFENMPQQESEAIMHDILFQTGKQNALIAMHLAKQGMSKHKKIGAITSNRLAVATQDGTSQFIAPGIPRLNRVADISGMEHDKMEVEAMDIPRAVGENRSDILVMAPIGMKTSNVIQAVPNLEAVTLAKKFLEETKERLFELLIDPGAHNAVFEKSTGAKGTATQVEASRAEQGKTEVTTLKLASEVFNQVYMEHGAMLDQMGIVNVVTHLQNKLYQYRVIDLLREFAADHAKLIGIDFKDVVEYMSNKKLRDTLIEMSGMGASTAPKPANPFSPPEPPSTKQKVSKMIHLTLDNLKNWEKLVEYARGLEGMFEVVYRSLVQGSSSNLVLQFNRKEEFMDEEEKEELKEEAGIQKEDAEKKKKEADKKKKQNAAKAAGGGKKKPAKQSSGEASGGQGEDLITVVIRKEGGKGKAKAK